MTSSSSELGFRSIVLGKRKPGDDFETKPFLRKHKDTSDEKTTKGLDDSLQHKSETLPKVAAVSKKSLIITNLCHKSTISEIIDFFKDVAQLVCVRRSLSRRRGLPRFFGFVEFASSKQAKMAMAKMNGECLRGRKICLSVPIKAPDPPPQYTMDYNVCYEDYSRGESPLMEADEGVLFIANLSPQTRIFHIKQFFDYVGQVVSVRLIVNHESRPVGYGFVEFASANEARKALEETNGEYLHDHTIFLFVAKKASYPPQPKYNLAEKLCYEDYLRRQNPVTEEDETVEGFDETPAFLEAIAVREKTVFVSGLYFKTAISDIISFFKDVGEVVHVRLITTNMGRHVGDGLIEFASANEAKKALEEKNGEYLHNRKIFLDVAKKAPYPLRPKYFIDHKVWYEDYLRRENLLIDEDEAEEGLDDIPDFVEEVAARKNTIFVTNIPKEYKMTNIMFFFKKLGHIVRFRLIVDHRGEHVGCCYIEFSSPEEAEKGLRKDNGHGLTRDVAKIAPYPLRPKYSLAENLWSKAEEGRLRKEREEYVDEEEEEEYVDEEEEEEYLDEEEEEYLDEEEEEYLDEEEEEDDEKPVMDIFCGKKITFSYDD